MTVVWIKDSGGSRGGALGGPRLPLIFIPNWWGLKGWKKKFWRPLPPTPYLSSGWLGPPYLKVWIWHCWTLNTIKFWKLYLWTEMWWFFINVLLLSRETEKALFYHPQLCSKKLGNEARQVTKLLQFLRTKWAPCDKKAHQGLLQTIRTQVTDYNLFLYLLFLSDLYQQTLVLKQHL